MQIQKRFLFFFLALIPLAVLIASLGRVFPSIGLNTKENHRQKNILAMSDIYYRQTFNNCAPYSAMAAINIITKKEIDPELLARETGWRIKNNLTMPQGLIQVLHKHGIKTKEKVLSCYSDAEKINWIKNTVDEGKPIILLIKIKKIRLKATATREAKTIPLNSISPNFMLRPLNPVVNTIEVRIKFFDFE